MTSMSNLSGTKVVTKGIDKGVIARTLQTAAEKGQTTLLETEGIALLEGMGLEVPKYIFVTSSKEAASLNQDSFKKKLGSDKVVVKVISHEILHKSDVGGVKIILNDVRSILSTIEDMERAFTRNRVEGYTINEFVKYDSSLGHELLFGMRWTEDFGAVITLGSGGIYTEFLSQCFIPGKEIALFHPDFTDETTKKNALSKLALNPILFGGLRGQKGFVAPEKISEIIDRFVETAREFMPRYIQEFEVNPLVIAERGPVALDVLLKLPKKQDIAAKESLYAIAAKRPVDKLKNLLHPTSAAIVGVSEKLNPGHIILNNLIRDGFTKENIYVVKPDTKTIEGCQCVSDIKALPRTVDLFVLAISAAQVPETITQIVEHKKAESILVIPGGLEEKEGTAQIVSKMKTSVEESRNTPWRGPLINGGNCLGIRSIPGKYDTMFIPEYKLPVPKGPQSPVALISQSGAFAVSRASKLSHLNLKYSISVGNQMDLTIGDYLTFLKDDPDIKIFAVYVEGFKPLDGARFLKAAKEITTTGRHVILYRAGRTPAGAKASASHTAAIAGDFSVTRELMQSVGVVIAESFGDFDDLVKLFTDLQGKKISGRKLGAISNAGCECVSIADNLGQLTLTSFSPETTGKLSETFKKCRIDEIVDVHNPIDLTPMAGDAGYEETVRTVLSDDGVDCGIVGIVPLTPALNNLPKSVHHSEDFTKPSATPSWLIRLKNEIDKPWVVVIDSGSLYDPFADLLEQNHIPTFRTADRALKLFNVYCARMLGSNA